MKSAAFAVAIDAIALAIWLGKAVATVPHDPWGLG